MSQFQRGLTYSKKDEADASDNVVVRATNIDLETNQLDFSELKYISEKIVVPVAKKLKKGSLLICTASGSKSHLGKVAFIDDDYDYSFGGFMGMLTPNEDLLPRYLFHLMTSGGYKDFIGQLADGANINNLKFDDLKRFHVPFPPIAEQRRIVGILDEAFEGIAKAVVNAEANLKNARELFESHLNAIFSNPGPDWTENKFGDICDIKHGFAFKSEFFVSNSKHVLLTPGNFFEAGGYRDRGDKQKFYDGPIPDGFVLEKGDLLIAMTEQAAGLLGSSIIIPESGVFLHNQRLGLVVPKEGVPWDNKFFALVFNTKAIRKAIHDGASGVKVRHTSPKKIANISVSFPTSVDEQQAIVAKLDKLAAETKRLEAIYRQKLALLAELKQSLLHKAFSGEL